VIILYRSCRTMQLLTNRYERNNACYSSYIWIQALRRLWRLNDANGYLIIYSSVFSSSRFTYLHKHLCELLIVMLIKRLKPETFLTDNLFIPTAQRLKSKCWKTAFKHNASGNINSISPFTFRKEKNWWRNHRFQSSRSSYACSCTSNLKIFLRYSYFKPSEG